MTENEMQITAIDFIDGEYANNESVRVEECKGIRNYDLKFDAHLMVVEKNIEKYARAVGELGFDRVIAQMESISYPEKFKCLALDVHSPVETIEPYLPKLNYVVVMAIEPGFGGQVFSGEVAEKIKMVSDKIMPWLKYFSAFNLQKKS